MACDAPAQSCRRANLPRLIEKDVKSLTGSAIRARRGATIRVPNQTPSRVPCEPAVVADIVRFAVDDIRVAVGRGLLRRDRNVGRVNMVVQGIRYRCAHRRRESGSSMPTHRAVILRVRTASRVPSATGKVSGVSHAHTACGCEHDHYKHDGDEAPDPVECSRLSQHSEMVISLISSVKAKSRYDESAVACLVLCRGFELVEGGAAV